MSNTDTINISHIKFASTVIPTEADVKLWASLSEAQKKAVIERELYEAEASGIAEPQSMADLIAEARAELKNEN